MESKTKTKKRIKKSKLNGQPSKRKPFILPKIFMSLDAMESIRSEALKYGQFETGGLILGEKTMVRGAYSIMVKKATGPGDKSEHGTHYFKPNNEYYQDVLRQELYRNSLIYIGEWHKHPGSFDQPSCTDLDTMKQITQDENTKDVLAIIATTPEPTEKQSLGEIVQINFYYYQRGMSDFIEVIPEIVQTPTLKGPQKKVEKLNLDVEKIIELVKEGKSLELEGNLTDNGTANIISGQEIHNPVKAKIIFNHGDTEISLNNLTCDVLVCISISNLRINARAWQLDDNTGQTIEINVDMIDLKESLFKRLGHLGIKEELMDKKVALLGLGSVGSTVAAQLAKAGINNLTLIDPDTLEVHNIIRHLCDLQDLGRFKIDAVKDKLLRINPDLNVTTIANDFVKKYDKISNIFEKIDLLIVSTDTPDSRQLANIASIEFNIPAVYISLHERARTGSVYRIVPGKTGCRSCVGDGKWGNEFIPGSTDYTDANNERDILFQPGLDTDISLVTMLGVKMAISSLLNPEADISPELKTNYLFWNGYPEENESMIKFVDGLGIPPNKECEICGSIKKNGEAMNE